MNVFITGGTSGLGLALAAHYLNARHRVGVCGRDLNKLPNEISSKYKKLEAFEVDVTERKKMSEIITQFAESGLDLIIANAGISDGNKHKTPDFERGHKIMATNVQGVLNTVEPAINIFTKQNSGHIVLMSSVAAFMGLPGSSFYCASKAAVFRLGESLTLDLKKENIHVTTLCPGFVDTPLTRKNKHSMPFIISDELAVKKMTKAIEAKKVLYLFPWKMALTVTLLNKIPRPLYRFLMELPFVNYGKKESV